MASGNQDRFLDSNVSASGIMKLRSILNDIRQHADFAHRHRERLVAADIAFLAHGASARDGHVGDDKFHAAFENFREGTPDEGIRELLKLKMRRLVFDQAAALDQATGGTTLVIHMPGALPPGSPSRPEYIKAYVYVSKAVLMEIESKGLPNPVPGIVQSVIRDLGVPTATRFDRARQKVWKTLRRMKPPTPRSLPRIEGMPMPIPDGSSRYLFYGHEEAFFQDLALYIAPVEQDKGEGDEGSYNAHLRSVSSTTLASDVD
ncbi:hypothetical protein DFP72DRAFT_1047728 [Ephemerocybe angulata]|uniref:Uncharacterized protein n=1 Tax=Ephemerocybe angulata TaxID=980116 RepID=A0A8H6HRV3_9AGAR|nr:hypothetical protein DFP72DRAFT_935046 [Tulosesus angulatus]KAF6751559.1 hypothetical protein DFP72DRAFT_1047728 [Tulosesus angulatus]